MDIELRNDRIPRNPFDRQFLDMINMDRQSTPINAVIASLVPRSYFIRGGFLFFKINKIGPGDETTWRA